MIHFLLRFFSFEEPHAIGGRVTERIDGGVRRKTCRALTDAFGLACDRVDDEFSARLILKA